MAVKNSTDSDLGNLVISCKAKIAGRLIPGILLAWTTACLLIYLITKGGIAAMVWSTIFIILSIRWFIGWNRNRGVRVDICENGLFSYKPLYLVYWRDVKEIKQIYPKRFGATQSSLFCTLSCTIEDYDGDVFMFKSDIKDFYTAVDLIQQNTFQYLFPRVQQMYRRGETVSFGILSINYLGITKDGNVLRWDRTKNIEITNGRVLIKEIDKWTNWANIPFSDIPNNLVFSKLTEEIMAA